MKMSQKLVKKFIDNEEHARLVLIAAGNREFIVFDAIKWLFHYLLESNGMGGGYQTFMTDMLDFEGGRDLLQVAPGFPAEYKDNPEELTLLFEAAASILEHTGIDVILPTLPTPE